MATQHDQPRGFACVGNGGAVAIAAAGGGQKLARFSGNAYTGSVMKPGGWYNGIIVDLDGVKVPLQHRPALRQHDPEQIVGHTTKVDVTRRGIMVDGVFSGQQEHVDKVVIPAKSGFQWQLSIGANPVRTEYLDAGKELIINNRTVTGPLTVSRETELGEISFVPLGADGNTEVNVAASAGERGILPLELRAIAAGEMARSQLISRLCRDAGDPVIDFVSDDGNKTREYLAVAAIRCGWPTDDVRDIIERGATYYGLHVGITAGAYLGEFRDVA